MSYVDQFALLGMRCVQQISLLKLWEQLRGKRELPQFEALMPEEISRSMDKLSFSEVIQVEKGYRFRIIQNGAQFDRIYPERRVGKFLDEVLPQAFRDQALLLHKQVVVSRRPSFSFSLLRKADGPLIRYERLLLPFTCHGGDVERIVGAITLFSEENGFDSNDVLTGRLIGP
ncbi:MAG: PAS domain-containing protein [Xanthobacteraceae bacterium]